MSLTRTQVIDAMNGALKTAWDAVNGGAYAGRIKWENVAKSEADGQDAPMSGNTPWLRSTIRHTPGQGKISLSNQVGLRRYDRRGVMIVQVFSPKGSGLPGTPDLAKVVQDAYEGQTVLPGLIIRTVDIQEIGVDGNWFQTNVSITFEYDELR